MNSGIEGLSVAAAGDLPAINNVAIAREIKRRKCMVNFLKWGRTARIYRPDAARTTSADYGIDFTFARSWIRAKAIDVISPPFSSL